MRRENPGQHTFPNVALPPLRQRYMSCLSTITTLHAEREFLIAREEDKEKCIIMKIHSVIHSFLLHIKFLLHFSSFAKFIMTDVYLVSLRSKGVTRVMV